MKDYIRCNRTNCKECEECVYDIIRKDKSKYMVKQNDLTKITCCNECPKSVCNDAPCDFGNMCNWHCRTKDVRRVIDMSVLTTKTIDIPNWCPLGLHKQNVEEEKKVETKVEIKAVHTPTVKTLTYAEKMRMWEAIELRKWEDIKTNTVYHVPPVLNEKRKDVLVTTKTDFSFTYRLLERGKPSSTAIYTVYKSNTWWKFMSEHKLRKVEVVNYNSSAIRK